MTVVTIGESMGLIRGGRIGDFTHLGSAEIDTGGAEGNVAIGLVRLGIPVAWLGRVGDDSLGRRVVRDLRGEGVDVRAVVDADATTGLMLKETPRFGSTTVTYYRRGSAGSRLQPSDLDGLEIEAASLLHITGVTLALSESARDTIRQRSRAGPRRGGARLVRRESPQSALGRGCRFPGLPRDRSVCRRTLRRERRGRPDARDARDCLDRASSQRVWLPWARPKWLSNTAPQAHRRA